MTPEETVEVWRRIIVGDHKSWVLFAHGTCVVLVEPADELGARAVELLRRYGPVRAGGPAGDFGVIELDPGPGWVVTGHHPDVLTYVAPDEVEDTGHLVVGVTGRGKRDRDGHELTVVHVEDRRST